MRQLVYKNGEVHGDTSIPYDAKTIKSMKSAGYVIKTVEDKPKEERTTKPNPKCEEVSSLW
jgi:hypothetical protein